MKSVVVVALTHIYSFARGQLRSATRSTEISAHLVGIQRFLDDPGRFPMENSLYLWARTVRSLLPEPPCEEGCL